MSRYSANVAMSPSMYRKRYTTGLDGQYIVVQLRGDKEEVAMSPSIQSRGGGQIYLMETKLDEMSVS